MQLIPIGTNISSKQQSFGMNFDENVTKELKSLADTIRKRIETSTDPSVQCNLAKTHGNLMQTRYFLENFSPYSTLCMEKNGDFYIRTFPDNEKVVLNGIKGTTISGFNRVIELLKAIKEMTPDMLKFGKYTDNDGVRSLLKVSTENGIETLIFPNIKGTTIKDRHILKEIIRALQSRL